MSGRERDVILPQTSTRIDIGVKELGGHPVLIVPLHVQEPRCLGNLGLKIIDSSYQNQIALLRFSEHREISTNELTLDDLVEREGVLLLGAHGKLVCRKVRPSGFVVLAITLPPHIIVHS